MKRALIVKLGAIGDVVMALPAAHALHLQGYSIDWIAAPQAASILRLYSFVRVIDVEQLVVSKASLPAKLRAFWQVWSSLMGAHYDVVATLYYDWRYRLITLPVMTAAHIRLREDDRAMRLLPGRHHTDEFARILLSSVRLEADDAGPKPTSFAPLRPDSLPPSPLPPATQRRVVLAPGGARNLLRDDMLRRWQIDHYAALAEMLTKSDIELILVGGADDTWIRQAFAAIPHIDLVDKLSLPELVALFDASDAVVTHDSGPLHLAGVTSCGLLGIFGPVDPWTRLPRRPGAVALWGGEGFGCRPCYDGSRYANCADNACMAQVTPDLAYTTVMSLLEQRAAGRFTPPSVQLPVINSARVGR